MGTALCASWPGPEADRGPVTASTTTTIRGVSIFSRQHKRKADVFDIALSPEGIAIQRPGRGDQYMGWDRVTQWEIEERPGWVLLTLRGGGSVTPLVVKGWTLDDLETVMRETTAGSRGPDPSDMEIAAPADVPDPPPATSDAPEVAAADEIAAETVVAEEAVSKVAAPEATAPVAAEPVQPRAARRHAARRPRRSIWKALVTIVLLAALATAVVVILLQSAGIISWNFLGPTA